MNKTLLYILLGFIVALSLLWLFQRKLMYHPATDHPRRSQYYAADMKELSLKTEDGLNIYAWYKPAVNKQLTVVFFHGNGGHLGGRMPLIRQLLDRGYGALLLSYRGYGGNPGSPTEQGLYADARAAMTFLQDKSKCLLIFGESLGTGVASQMALEFKIQGLILQAPFSSMTEVAQFHYPWALIPPTDKYATIERIDKIQVPTLVIHGTNDKIVPYQQGLKVFEASAAKDKKLLTMKNHGHNDLWQRRFLDNVLNFLGKVDKLCLLRG